MSMVGANKACCLLHSIAIVVPQEYAPRNLLMFMNKTDSAGLHKLKYRSQKCLVFPTCFEKGSMEIYDFN